MPVISVNIAALSNIIDTSAIKLPEVSADNFLSLLNSGTNQTNGNAGAGNHDSSASQSSGYDQNRRNNNTVAVPIDQPLPFAQQQAPVVPEPVHTAAPVTASQDQNNTPDNNHTAVNSPNTGHQTPQDSATQNAPQAGQPATNTPATTPSANQAGQQTQSTGNSANSGTDDATKKQASNQAQLGNIDQLLLSIIQALSGGVVVPQATNASDQNTTAVAAQTSVSVTGVNAQGTVGSVPGATTLLQDIHSILQQLQQVVQAGNGQLNNGSQSASLDLATVAQAGGANVQTLTDALSKDISQLTQLLKQGADGAGSPPPALASVAAANVASPAVSSPQSQVTDLVAQIKSDITQVRGQLKQFKNNNENVFAQAKADLQSQFDSVRQFFKNVAQSSPAADTTAGNVSTPAAQPSVQVSVAGGDPLQTGKNPAGLDPQNLLATLTGIINGNNVPQRVIESVSQTNDSNAQVQNASGIVPLPVSGPVQSPSSPVESFAKTLAQASSGPVLDQVAFQIKTAVNDGSSKIHIQLDPAELGKLDIRLNVGADGKTNVVIHVDNQTTLDLLQRDTQGLTRALNDAGLSTDSGSLSFNLRSGQQDQGQGGNSQAAQTYKKIQPEEEDIAVNVITQNYTVNLATGLDIKI